MYLAAINGHYKIVDKLKHCTGIHYSIKRYKRGGLHKNRPFFVRKRELQDRELAYPFHHPQFCLFYLFFFFFFFGIVEYRCTKIQLIWWGKSLI